LIMSMSGGLSIIRPCDTSFRSLIVRMRNDPSALACGARKANSGLAVGTTESIGTYTTKSWGLRRPILSTQRHATSSNSTKSRESAFGCLVTDLTVTTGTVNVLIF